MRLLCVCPNPALDHTVVVERIEKGETTRASASVTTAGGKGLNVARFAAGFGVPTQSVTCAGEVGADHLDLLARYANLNLITVECPEATVRICPIVVSSEDWSAFTASDPAVAIDPAIWSKFTDLVVRLAGDASVVCVSGSYPEVEGINPADTLLAALGSHPRVWVDTSGAALRTVFEKHPNTALKINLAEAWALIAELQLAPELDAPELVALKLVAPELVVPDQDTARRDIADPESAIDTTTLRGHALAVCNLLGQRRREVIVTAGRHGAAAKVDGAVRWLSAPTVDARNATASGDAFLAGYVSAGTGLLNQLRDPLVAGLCAGAANAQSWYPNSPAGTVLELAAEHLKP
ncbi:MAG: PfkB family carbohydrate kinase [Acidimicrobiaceae bacterium]|nr:PfkB family carbohydrate kinase [Acidimicrobiaceae bacterium]